MSNSTPKLNYAFLCDYAFLSVGMKLNIIGIFKKIKVKNVPFQHPLMFVVANIAVPSKGNYQVVVRFIRERDGAEILPRLNFDLSVDSDERAEKGELGVIGQIQNLKIEEEGLYKILIFVNEEKIGDLPLNILH